MTNRNLYLPILSLFALSLIWTACSKNTSKETNPDSADSTSTVAATPISLLTLSAWKYDTSGYDMNKDGVIDEPADTTVVPVCERDDSYTFYVGYTGSANAGTDLCTAQQSELTSFTWSLDTVESQAILTATINSVMNEGVTVLKLDSTELSVYRDSTYGGTSYRYIVDFRH